MDRQRNAGRQTYPQMDRQRNGASGRQADKHTDGKSLTANTQTCIWRKGRQIHSQSHTQTAGMLRHTCEELIFNVDEVLGSPDGMHIHVVQACIYEHPLTPPQAPPQHHAWVLLINLEVGRSRIHAPVVQRQHQHAVVCSPALRCDMQKPPGHMVKMMMKALHHDFRLCNS